MIMQVKNAVPTFAEAVDTGFKTSGLEVSVLNTEGPTLIAGLKDYVIIMLEAFTNRGAMWERYQTARGTLAAMHGRYYFDAVLGQIQEGDLALFKGGLFFSGIHREHETKKAQHAYHNAAILLRGNREANGFFYFLQSNVPQVMEGLAVTGEQLRIPRQRVGLLYVPAMECMLSQD